MKSLVNLFMTGVLAAIGFWLGHQNQATGLITTNTPVPIAQVKSPVPAWGAELTTVLQEGKQDGLLAFCAEKIPLSEIPAALRRLGPLASEDVLTLLFQRWAEDDPKAAILFFKKFGVPDAAAKGIGVALLKTWTEKDSKAAAEFSLAEIDAKESIFSREQLWTTLAHQDGAAAFQKGLTSLVGMEEIFSEWAKQDVKAAAAALEKIPPGMRLEQAAYEVLDQAMENNPQAALAWFRGLPDSIRAAVGMNKLISRYQDAPPEVKFSLLGEQLVGFGHNDDVSKALRAARKLDPTDSQRGEAITKLSDSIGGHVGDELRSWAAKDATGALTWAQQFPDPTLRPVLMGQFAQEMISQGQVESGLGAMQGLPQQTQESLIKAAASKATKDSAMETADKIPEGPLREAFLNALPKE